MAQLTGSPIPPIDLVDSVKAEAKSAAADIGPHITPWVERFARLGYAAKGAVYCLIGVFAILAIFGAGSGPRGTRSVLRVLMDQPLGYILLGTVALGLAGYTLWCFITAVFNPERRSFPTRVFNFGKGIVHGSLFLAALGILFGKAVVHRDDGEVARHWTAQLMSYPFGKWLAVGVGIGIALYGLKQIQRAWRSDLDKRLMLAEVEPDTAHGLRNIARFGIAARGIVFNVIGIALITAGYHADPSEAKGLPDALAYLGRHTFGEWLLGTVAAGLIAYGIYEFTRARYRHIRVG